MYKDVPRYARTHSTMYFFRKPVLGLHESNTAPFVSLSRETHESFLPPAIPEPLVQTPKGSGRRPRAARPSIRVCFVLLAHWAGTYQFICLPSSSSGKKKNGSSSNYSPPPFPDLWLKVSVFFLIQVLPVIQKWRQPTRR